MKIVDINLLIYAINKDTPHHSKAKKFLCPLELLLT